MINEEIDKKYHFLYKTTNLLNGKFYYGMHSTTDLDDGYLGSGRHLKNSIKKYGKENFNRKIISFFDSREDLVKAEIELITEDLIEDPNCYNAQMGGDGWKPNTIPVKDIKGNYFRVYKEDSRYLSGELAHVSTGTVIVRDKDNNCFRVYKEDPRYLSGELIYHLTGMIIAKDKNGKTLNVDINDPRYLSGELVHIWTGRKHTEETKKKMSLADRTAEKNSQYGTMWITNGINSKKIKKDETIPEGWTKGRVQNKINKI